MLERCFHVFCGCLKDFFLFWILIKHKLITSYNGDILCVFSPTQKKKKKKNVFIFVKNTKKIEICDCFSFFLKKKNYIISQRLWNATPNNYMIRRKIVSLHVELIGKVIKVKDRGLEFSILKQGWTTNGYHIWCNI